MMDKSKPRIYERSSGMGREFLSDLWRTTDSLPRIKGFEIIWYYMQRGFQTIASLPMSNSITIATIAVSLFLFGGTLLGLQNVDATIAGAGNALDITAYLKDSSKKESITKFRKALRTNPHVAHINFISKEKALELFKNDLGSRSGFLDGLENDNPLPASLEITLRSHQSSKGDVEKLIKYIESRPIVDQVVYGSVWVDKARNALRIFRFIGVVILLIVMGIVIFLITNTIKIVIHSRQDEIEVMQLVGASDNFVRVPFILGGLFQGLIGSAIGLGMLQLGFSFLNYQLQNSVIFGIALPHLFLLDIPLVAAILVLGMFIGSVGSFLALGKFMNA